MGMKNSVKITGMLGAALLLATGFCAGQVAGTARPAKSARETKPAKEMTVAGYALDPLEHQPVTVTGYPITVTGYPISVKDLVSIRRKATLTFTGESKTSEVKINMTEDYNFLKIFIQSSFRSGSIAVELVDPKGEKRGEYHLKSNDLIITGDKTTIQEEVVGNLQKDFSNPLKGEWIVRAVPVSAEGTITVMIIQEYAPVLGTTEPAEVIGYPLPAIKR